MVGSVLAKFGVHEDKGEVGEEIGDTHEDAVEHDNADEESVVLGGDGKNEVLSHAGNEEDCFDNERTGDDGGEGWTQECHCRHKRGAQGHVW